MSKHEATFIAALERPDCYECVHRRDLPGSAHSRCEHPAFTSALGDPLLSMYAILGSVGRVPPVSTRREACLVVGDSYGTRKGWFQHPFNFDPLWLMSCSGFQGST